MNKYLN